MFAQNVGSGRRTHHVLFSFFLFILALVLTNERILCKADIGFFRLLVLEATKPKSVDIVDYQSKPKKHFFGLFW